MIRITLALLTIGLLGSCALNKIFLHPYTLSTDNTFSEYNEDLGDTLTMRFNGDHSPVILNSSEEIADLPYTITQNNFPNNNGDTLNAWLIQPKKNYNGTTLYFLHGNAANMVYQFGFMIPFVERGFQVFMIDYSGFGFSQGASTRKNVLIDGNSGLDYLIGRKDITYDKLIVYGQSLGGHLAAVVATQNQEKIDGLVIEGAFSSHSDIAADNVPVIGRIFTREMYSAKRSLPKLHKPVLIIHSTEDETVAYKNSLRLDKVATQPKEFYTIDKAHIRGPLYYADSIVAKMERLMY